MTLFREHKLISNGINKVANNKTTINKVQNSKIKAEYSSIKLQIKLQTSSSTIFPFTTSLSMSKIEESTVG